MNVDFSRTNGPVLARTRPDLQRGEKRESSYFIFRFFGNLPLRTGVSDTYIPTYESPPDGSTLSPSLRPPWIRFGGPGGSPI
jgi:hypothetical protein